MAKVLKGKFNLGDKVKDTITGYPGICVGLIFWMYGCNRVGIDSESLSNDGKIMETQWFDEQRVELIQPEKIKIKQSKIGGPKMEPTQFSPLR